MFDPQDDPLGLGLKQRARERRMGMFSENPALAGLQSPLGEDWDAWFQATDEAAGGRPVKLAAFGDASSPVSPDADPGALFAAHSNQLRGAGMQNPYALDGLRKLKKR